MATAHDILDQALRLPEDEREQLAWTLLDSLHAGRDDDAADAWAHEVRRRLDDYRAGRSSGRAWDEVEADLRARLQRK